MKKEEKLVVVRCHGCQRFLGKINGTAEIKCPKCKKVNHFNE